MDGSRATPGTVYFAASITVLFALLWRPAGPPDRVPIATAATMAMMLVQGVATLAEALSPAGTDNLSVPRWSGLALYLGGGLA